MNKQEIIDYLKGQTEWSGNHHYILVNKSELISMIEDLDELEFKNYLRDIKSQIDYLRIQGPGKVKSLRMLENMVDNMLTGYWSSTSIRTEKVKVPAFVVPFIEKLKITNRRYGVELEKAYNNGEDEELVNWLWFNENVLTLFRALESGYEVEEKPKWVVYGERGYLTSLSISKGKSTGWTGNGDKHGSAAIHFDDKELAQYTAYITGGTVEKV